MEPLQKWCLEDGFLSPTGEALIGGFAEQVRAAGIPADRLSVAIQVLHPVLAGQGWIWTDGALKCLRWPVAGLASQTYLLSPVRAILNGEVALIRRRVDVPEPGYPVLEELKELGFCDYLALRLLAGDGKPHLLSVATRDPAGFTEAQIGTLERAVPLFQILVDRQILRLLSRTVSETYIGHKTGPRVMQGAIRRGTVERLRAAIWFSDIRNFTGLSLDLGPEWIVELLNQYFGAVGVAVEESAGEILKFIGDAALVVFPVTTTDAAACEAALGCLRRVQAEVASVNAAREQQALPPIRYGVGLHIGEVAYGNIGAPARLDFTVIGPAVNLASRLEGLCAQTGAPAVLSEDFARALPPGTVAPPLLGTFTLKGIPAPQRVYGAPD